MPAGKKQCPKCDEFVGPRLKKCECGHEFVFKVKKSAPGTVPPPIVTATPEGARYSTPRRRPPPLPTKAAPDDRPMTEKSAKHVFRIKDRTLLKDFLWELRSARGESERTGGMYSAFLYLENGDSIQFEVWLPMMPKK